MNSMEYFDRKGKPITQEKWGELFSDKAYCRIAEDNLRGRYVSTVYLGLNHNYGDGPPLIFETMVFGRTEDGSDGQWRYSTEKEAKEGHQKAVDAIRAEPVEGLNPEWHGDKLFATCSGCGKMVQMNKKAGGLHVCE